MRPSTMAEQEVGTGIVDIEIKLLFEGVFLHTGFDFRAFRPGYLKERVLRFMDREDVATVSGLQERLLHGSGPMDRFLQSFSLGPDRLFYEPQFFLDFRRKVAPLLPSGVDARAWVAGCTNGAEAYSLAILLHEEGMQEKTRVYVCEKNGGRAAGAKEGVIPLDAVKGCSRGYQAAGGKRSLSGYYSREAGQARMNASLRENLVWTGHNLVTDASFNQFHCILCRNVFGLFTEPLAGRVHELIYESLTMGGLLGLSSGDAIHPLYEGCYEALKGSKYWHRKVR
jgi:chemotaxis protein methyltransferase CheR